MGRVTLVAFEGDILVLAPSYYSLWVFYFLFIYFLPCQSGEA